MQKKREERVDNTKPLTPARVKRARREKKEGKKKATEPRGTETREGEGSQTKQRDKRKPRSNGLHRAKSKKSSMETDDVKSEAREGQERKKGPGRARGEEIPRRTSRMETAHMETTQQRGKRNSTAKGQRKRRLGKPRRH